MKTTKTNETIKAQDEVLNASSFDVDFAMEDPKAATKKSAKKAEPKPVEKTAKKAPAKKEETKSEIKKPETKKATKKAEPKPAEKKAEKKPEATSAPKAKKGKIKPLVFDSVTPAAQYLADLLGLKITNAKDCLYKALRGKGQTHKFNVSKNETNKIVLTPIA